VFLSQGSSKDIYNPQDSKQMAVTSSTAEIWSFWKPGTTISYSIPAVETGYIPSLQLKIYDVLGREVKTLVNEFKSQGRYSINFNAGTLASGVYIYRIKVNDFSTAKKLLLMK